MGRLLKNKVLVCNSFSTVCFTFGFLGQWIFLPKYMETQFHKSASEVTFISGMSLAFVAGTPSTNK
jgi:Organic Anion Transporter Polypeptide (OATP) family